MKITLTATAEFVEINGVFKARIWEGVSETGVPVRAIIAALEVPCDVDLGEFDADLKPIEVVVIEPFDPSKN